MKRSADAPTKSKTAMIVIKALECRVIEELQNNILGCARDLDEACDGEMCFNPTHFVRLINLLQTSIGIANSHSDLEGAWFAVFFEEGAGGQCEMVTTFEIRNVSVGARRGKCVKI